MRELCFYVLIVFLVPEAYAVPTFSESCESEFSFTPSLFLTQAKQKSLEVVLQKSGPDLDIEVDMRSRTSDILLKWNYFKELSTNVDAVVHKDLELKFEQLKTHFIEATIDHVKNSSVFLREVTDMKLVPFQVFLKKDIDELKYYWMGWNERGNILEIACRSDGLHLSAIYYEPDNAVVMCPGTVLRLQNNEITMSSLSFLISHELSHSVDFDKTPDLYSNLDIFMNLKIDFYKEVSADYWGAKTFSLTQPSSDEVVDNLKYFCGLPEETEGSLLYTSGDDRVRYVLKNME